ncbi:MAG: hypothetical protein D6748_05200 [Calditrichaeota bacterium]|nr:MAG: hypothetical protein D6748_05200 [Calditrichota bacterium]
MSNIEISLIAVEIKKWDLETQKITTQSYYVLNDEEYNIQFDVTILQPPEMVEEYLGKLRYECAQFLQSKLGKEELEVEFDNETFLRQKLYNYFKRITMELNNPKRRKGQPKMIFTTHMDIYNENQDISFLPKKLQFFVVLNWARKYYEKEDYKKAIEPLRKLIAVKPDFGLGYKWLARSLKKIRKYDEAMHYYQKYAEVDGSIDSLLDLAKSYRKGKIFDKSEEIYHQILEKDPGNKEARIGLAQIRYATKNDEYLKILDELYAEDPEWLKEWLVEEFNFRIYVPEKTLLTPNQTAKFLGFSQIFELTQRAFKNEIPSHFNPAKAKLSFYKEEIENWAFVMNRYKCLPEEIKLYPERIEMEWVTEEAVEEPEDKKASAPQDSANSKPLTKVEEILMQIRARKAQRQQANAANSNNESGKKSTKKSSGKKSSSKTAAKNEEKEATGKKNQKKASTSRKSRKKEEPTVVEKNGMDVDDSEAELSSPRKPAKKPATME